MVHIKRQRRERHLGTLALTRDTSILEFNWKLVRIGAKKSKLTKPLLLKASVNLLMSSVLISNAAISAPLVFIVASATIAGADRYTVT
jgi:hypothetical protein